MSENLEQDEDEGDRQRNGRSDHECRAPAHREEEHDEHDAGRHQQVLGETVQARISVFTLIENRVDAQTGRRILSKITDDFLGSFSPFVDALVFGDEGTDKNGSLAVFERHADGWILKSLLNRRHVTDAHLRTIWPLQQRHRPDAGYVVKLAADFEADIAAFRAQAPGGGLAVCRGDERRRLTDSESRSRKSIGIDNDANFFSGHAIKVGQFRSRQALETVLKFTRHAAHHGERWIALPLPDEPDHQGRRADILAMNFRCVRACGKL